MTNDKTKKKIEPFPSWPHFDKDEIKAVTAVLDSGRVNYWTGENGRLFEKEFSDFIGCKHAVALANGTVALELALYALGIGPGDEVIVPCRTFIASASCAVMRGAKPVMADIDPVSQNITAEMIKPHITPRTKAIVVVHLAGWPCDMEDLMELAHEYNLKVIEDCAQAHGARYKGKPVGSFGHLAAFSFCQDKIMTTGGEGGMLTTNDPVFWEKAWAFKDHGKNFDAVYNRKQGIGYNWVHESFGTNWRMTEIQAAIGRIQLKKLSEWVIKRQKNAAFLTSCFSDIPALRVTIPNDDIGHSYYKYYTFLNTSLLKKNWNRDRVIDGIKAEGIPCFSGSCSEIYLEKAFDKNDFRPATRFPVARALGETSLMFCVHPTLRKRNLLDTCDVVKKVISKAIC